jgi:hypothetical protein
VAGYVAYKLNARSLQPAGGRPQLLSVPIEGDHRRTFVKEPPYDRQTDPLGCSSYYDALSTELRHVRLLDRWCADG